MVEVSPPYDSNGEVTALAAAELLYELMSIMAIHPLDKVSVTPDVRPKRPGQHATGDSPQAHVPVSEYERRLRHVMDTYVRPTTMFAVDLALLPAACLKHGVLSLLGR